MINSAVTPVGLFAVVAATSPAHCGAGDDGALVDPKAGQVNILHRAHTGAETHPWRQARGPLAEAAVRVVEEERSWHERHSTSAHWRTPGVRDDRLVPTRAPSSPAPQ